ncbi:L-histidine N(alpha)-methyltransferase [Chloroflexota bacterium]
MPEKYRVIKSVGVEATGCDFASDVDAGLSSLHKSISSKYLYDAEGDRLFQQIMELPEYYLTRCEYEILRDNRDEILALLGDIPVNLVELGAGDGKKTFLLLEHFLEKGLQFRYVPIDISESAIKGLIASCCDCYSQMTVEGLVADYFDGLKWLAQLNQRRNFVLFLGSNIGNFAQAETELFLRGLRDALNNDDLVLIGFDLKKDVNRIKHAYDDSQGVTAQFNLNLLRRINSELGGDFKINRFQHYCTYNEQLGAVESHLISSEKQDVIIQSLGKTYCFEKKESLHIEYSHKFSKEDITQLAQNAGFKIVAQFYDAERLFVDSVWQVIN